MLSHGIYSDLTCHIAQRIALEEMSSSDIGARGFALVHQLNRLLLVLEGFTLVHQLDNNQVKFGTCTSACKLSTHASVYDE